MSKQIMLVNVNDDETRIALTEDGQLVGLHVEQTDRERTVGNIYRGTVVKVNPAFQAAFVDYGEDRNGFLSISDVNPATLPGDNGGKRRARIQDVIREGQTVMVQVLKEGLRNKGSALSTYISMPGRYLVVTPDSDRSGVSRKVDDSATRQGLKDVLTALQGTDDLGIIIRTAGIGRSVGDLKRDLDALRKQWRSVQDTFKKMRRPGLVHAEPSPIVRVLRDYFTEEVQEVWVDDPEGFQEALRYFKSTLPKFQKRLKLYVGDKSLFSAYKVEEQIESLDSSVVPLPSGGSLVIESTEALVSVDVNSGRSQGSDIEETALQTNQEAAVEIARQLRLRNLGGLIVIDFIDMFAVKNRKKVEKTLTDALKEDKARTTVGQISQFGLLELSRQRIDMELTHGLRVQCPACSGTGYVPTVNASANNVLRKIRELAATGKYGEIYGDLPLEAANYLLNEKREALRDLELEFEIRLHLKGDPSLPPGHDIHLYGRRIEEFEGGEEPVEPAAAQSGQAGEEAGSGRRRRRRRRRGGRRDEEQVAAEAPETEEDLAAEFAHRPYGVEDIESLEPVTPADEEPEAEEEVEAEAREEQPHRRERGGRRPEREPQAPRQERQRDRRPRRHEPAAEAAFVPGEPGEGSGVLVFHSEHIVTDPEAVAKIPPARVRSQPFAAIIDSVQPNTVIFDSAKLGNGGAQAVQAEEETRPAAAQEGEGKGRKRRRSRKPKAAETVAGAEESAGTPPVAAQESEPAGDDTAEASARKPSRRRRSRKPKAEAAEAAPVAEEQAPAAADAGEAEAPVKPSRRKRPSRSRKAAAPTGEAPAPQAPANGAAEAEANGPAAEESTDAAAKRPSRRRRPRRSRPAGQESAPAGVPASD